ncbi:TatD related DNase [Zea mays]|uniref:TatD related DNase n=1 Tax=Zea mays TaxID=4577 RepID=A0A1D6ERR3_MAIZE|nr:TatD related DNase [Zea mays]
MHPRHSTYREVSIMMLMAYLSYMLAEVIVWWAGLMRGVVSIALAYNKVNLVIGLSGLSFGLELCYCFCFIYPFQNIGHFLLSSVLNISIWILITETTVKFDTLLFFISQSGQMIVHRGCRCNGCSLKTNENLEVLRGIPVERLMIETDSPYCDIINAHAGSQYVKSVWPSKKKEKYEPDSTVKGRNEPCLVRQVLEVVAGSKGISDIEGLSRTLYHNTCRLFFPQDLDASANAQLESGTTVQDC